MNFSFYFAACLLLIALCLLMLWPIAVASRRVKAQIRLLHDSAACDICRSRANDESP